MMGNISMRKVIYVVLAIYITCSLWVVYVVLLENNPTVTESSSNKKLIVDEKSKGSELKVKEQKQLSRVINIWGKAAIAEYLWVHLFEGILLEVPGFLLHKGSVTIENMKLSYTTGPSLIIETADKGIKDVIVILNGREQSKVNFAKSWLNALVNKEKFYQLKNLGIILLGNEICANDWVWYYVDKYSTLIKFVFIVYDVGYDGSRPVYQWPLGVATYRHFPLIMKVNVDVNTKRKYKCNFLGTIFGNSSRELLTKLLQDGSYNCYIKARHTWLGKETKESMSLYDDVLHSSDLTLCPVGINSESYRIYEAFSFGSIPVLEDVMTPGQCGKDTSYNNPPYSLLKKHKAPVIYIKDWYDLPELLRKEALLTDKEIIERRKNVLEWYEVFRYNMREDLMRAILLNFE